MAAAVPTLISMAETTRSFQGRGVLAKHKAYSMYRVRQISVCEQLVDSALKSLAQASSVIVAQTIADVRLSLRHTGSAPLTPLSLSLSLQFPVFFAQLTAYTLVIYFVRHRST